MTGCARRSGAVPIPPVVSPQPLAVGLGLRPGLSVEGVLAALAEILPGQRIACLATLDRRAGEPGPLGAAAVLGVPLHGYCAERLARVPVPNPSDRVLAALGVPGVAEAAALLAGTGPLLVPRQVVEGVVVAATAARPDRNSPRQA